MQDLKGSHQTLPISPLAVKSLFETCLASVDICWSYQWLSSSYALQRVVKASRAATPGALSSASPCAPPSASSSASQSGASTTALLIMQPGVQPVQLQASSAPWLRCCGPMRRPLHVQPAAARRRRGFVLQCVTKELTQESLSPSWHT